MKLNELSIIKSERGLRSVFSALFFGAKGALLSAAANFESISRTVSNLRQAGYADRADDIVNGKRFTTLETALNTAAVKAASIQTMADTHGIVLEVDFTPDVQRGKDAKQIEDAAAASGVPAELIKQKEQEAIKRRYDQQEQAKSAAETAFWTADHNEEVEVKTETVLAALVRQRNYMLEWNTLDLGELTILKHDIERIEQLLAIEEERGEPTAGSIDDVQAVDKSAKQMNDEYQGAIASAMADTEEVAQPPKAKRRVVKKAA
jgi:hypothetical protein